MKYFTIFLLIPVLFYQCNHAGSTAENEVSSAVQTPPEQILPGFWLAGHPAKKGEVTVLECASAPQDVFIYNYVMHSGKYSWALRNFGIEIFSEGNDVPLFRSSVISDSALQIITPQNMKMNLTKKSFIKKESFEFAGMLTGLAFEDHEIFLEKPAYLFVHSAINDSIVRFNVFGQGGKKITTVGTIDYGGKMQKGNYFIRAFQRRDLEEIKDKAAFRIDFTLFHTEE